MNGPVEMSGVGGERHGDFGIIGCSVEHRLHLVLALVIVEMSTESIWIVIIAVELDGSDKVITIPARVATGSITSTRAERTAVRIVRCMYSVCVGGYVGGSRCGCSARGTCRCNSLRRGPHRPDGPRRCCGTCTPDPRRYVCCITLHRLSGR